MAAKRLLDEKLSTLEREIEDAEEYLSLVLAAPRPHGLPRLSRDISVYLIARSTERRIFALHAELRTARALRRHLTSSGFTRRV